MIRFGRCGDCDQMGALYRSKRLGRVVCGSCVARTAHPTILRVVCGGCGVETGNLVGHLKCNPRCPQLEAEEKNRDAQGRAFRNSRLVPLDVAWDPGEHQIWQEVAVRGA